MERLIIFLGVLILLLDLADDGYIGKVKFVAPHNLFYSVAANQPANQKASKVVFGQGNFTVALLVTDLLEISRHSHHKSAEVEVPHPGKITLCSHLCSSGGLPL